MNHTQEIKQIKNNDKFYKAEPKAHKTIKVRRQKNHHHLVGYTIEQLEELADRDFHHLMD